VAPPRTRTWLRAACALVVLALAAERWRALGAAPPTDFDDAYMFIRYANNWLLGYGFAWNRGQPPVYGATSLPHVLVVALFRWARPRLDDAAVLQSSSRAAAGLLLLVLVATCARFARHPRLRGEVWLWGALLLPLVCFSEPFFFHAETGMDTMLAALANAGLILASLHLSERPTVRAALVTAVVGYLAYLVRPDNALYAALVPTLALTFGASPAAAPGAGAREVSGAGARGVSGGSRRRALIGFGAALAGLVAIDLLLKRRCLGTAWPLGAYAKRARFYGGFAGEYTWNPFLFLEVFWSGLWPLVVALVAFTGRRSLGRVAALLLPLLLTFPLFFRINQIMGHLGRFYFPALPLVVVAAALSFDGWLSAAGAAPAGPARAQLWRSLAGRLAAGVLLLVVGRAALRAAGKSYEARAASQSLAPLGGYQISATRPLPELDSWRSSEVMARLARDAPAGARFAMSEHGLVGARAPDAVIIDVLGLHDRWFAQHGFSAAELWRRQPDLIWMPHPDHTQMIRDILDSPELWSHYVFYPDAFSYGVALRLDGPRYPALAPILRSAWETSYPDFPQSQYAAHRSALSR
jgi:hypothetical protein